MIKVINDEINFFELLETEPRPVVIWGAGRWGRMMNTDKFFEVDSFCDIDKEKWGNYIDGITILSPKELETRYEKEAIYIVSTIPENEFPSLFCYLCGNNYNADIVNPFSNRGFNLNINSFQYKNVELGLFEHIHNCGSIKRRMSERAIEVSLGRHWCEKMGNKEIMEVGAVTPYYFPGMIKDVIDPADNHILVTKHESLFDVELTKNVLCISTVEHIGTGQYGVNETRDAIMAIEKILEESEHCLITTPIGENPLIDYYFRTRITDKRVSFFMRKGIGNKWDYFENTSEADEIIRYSRMVHRMYVDRRELGANSVVMIIEQ